MKLAVSFLKLCPKENGTFSGFNVNGQGEQCQNHLNPFVALKGGGPFLLAAQMETFFVSGH